MSSPMTPTEEKELPDELDTEMFNDWPLETRIPLTGLVIINEGELCCAWPVVAQATRQTTKADLRPSAEALADRLLVRGQMDLMVGCSQKMGR
jgi:hypothetical protein